MFRYIRLLVSQELHLPFLKLTIRYIQRRKRPFLYLMDMLQKLLLGKLSGTVRVPFIRTGKTCGTTVSPCFGKDVFHFRHSYFVFNSIMPQIYTINPNTQHKKRLTSTKDGQASLIYVTMYLLFPDKYINRRTGKIPVLAYLVLKETFVRVLDPLRQVTEEHERRHAARR